MRALAVSALLALCLACQSGCILPAYSGDPVRRTQQLIFTSEGFRHFLEEWERFWFLDQPDHLTPHRTHGGIL
ncbi:MAG: hypothetical protein DWQ31_05920 [Planctomycetota bacterium]|nr:MAG: hypothetical protein DWQ31_05920 [Planctomycetota bacterium]REJ98548.1 MAG: hypothetical protein DWQ35_00675 [Planctomycetota bacterium]REK29848.1 MAG: hypothetical protein DWQ42_02795 [Planctomycetota bacterium]REK47981.1 MAG: hypothetical protein DWQ46_03560 [Planctomycetota bacterium]